MNLPKGSTFLKKVTLPSELFQTQIENLKQSHFSGCVHIELKELSSFKIFFKGGEEFRILEFPPNVQPAIENLPRIMRVVVGRDQFDASIEVLLPQMVEVYAAQFCFRPLYDKHPLKRGELKNIVDSLVEDSYTGFVQVKGPEGHVGFAMESGGWVTNRISTFAGEMLCHADAISTVLDYVHTNGGPLSAIAETDSRVSMMVGEGERSLERCRQLIVKKESGWFRSEGIARVSTDIAAEWGIDQKEFLLDVENSVGNRHRVRANAVKRMGNNIGLDGNTMTKFGLDEEDVCTVKPVLS